MADDGETKDDVKVPDGEVGEKIDRLFTTEEKDTSQFQMVLASISVANCAVKMSLFLLLWVNKQLLKPRRLHVVRQFTNDIDLPVTNGIFSLSATTWAPAEYLGLIDICFPSRTLSGNMISDYVMWTLQATFSFPKLDVT